jgi:hypothetical protein
VYRRHFGAGAIGWALFLYGQDRLPARTVRDRVGGYGAPDSGHWITLRRWLAAIAHGRLFSVRPSPADFTTRQVAERAAMCFASFAPSDTRFAALAAQVFKGADRRAGSVMASRAIHAARRAPPRWSADGSEDT